MHACFDRARWFLASSSYDTKSTKQIVLWLQSRFGTAYKRDGGPNVVKKIITAPIKRDKMAGLADHINVLKDKHALAMGKLLQ